MSSHIPWFTMNNYTPLMNKEFSSDEPVDRFSIRELFAVLQNPFTGTYADLDARTLPDFLQNEAPTGNHLFNGTQNSKKDLLVALKLLCPSLWCCDYFFWNVWKWTHTGVDIILPQNTPIISFTDWKVVRIKTWDWSAKDEWNCVAVESTDWYVVGYEHLERIDVTVGQVLKQGDQIGLCGTTWYSTQYHLHVQVDKWFAPFHPYWSENLKDIQKYTIDPLPYFRAWSPQSPFIDMPKEKIYQDAIKILSKWLIIKWFDRHIYPEKTVKRYEAALMIDRTLRLYSMYDNRPVVSSDFSPYSDNTLWDSELDEALERLQKYWIMKWHWGNFYPLKQLLWEELLALLWRIFYWLVDNEHGNRWNNYLAKFQDEWIIAENWSYIGKPAPRKEVFLLFSILLQRKGIL